MKAVLHTAASRGGGEHGWLKTRHSFSFANWYEPSRMGFGALRVINDDRIAPHTGFGAHSHRDMEIITIVTEGAVTHKDSIGNTETVPAGDVQTMSAGTGVTHAEMNDGDEELALFQIWIEPKELDITPKYAQAHFGVNVTEPGLELLVAPHGYGEGLPICQNAYIYRGLTTDGVPVHYTPMDARHGVYVFVIEGTVVVAGQELTARDGLGLSELSETEDITIESSAPAMFLLMEVPLTANGD